MYTLYKQTTPIKDATGQIIGWETEPVNVADDFFIQFGLTFDWKNKTVSKNGVTYYLDTNSTIPSPDEWLATYGNYIQTYYYAVGEDIEKNPSNNPKNIKRRIYFNSQNIKKFDIRYEWDANDNIVREYSIAPNKEGAVNYKVTISNSDPTSVGSTWVKTYPEGTAIKVEELKSALSAEISTYNILGLKKSGSSTYISDFTITENVELTAVWEAKEVTLTLDYNFVDSDNNTTTISKTITQTMGSQFSFNSVDVFNELFADSWRKSAFNAPESFVYDDESMGPDFNKVLWNNTTIEINCAYKDITINVVDSEGTQQYSDTYNYGDTIDISTIAPTEEGKTLKSCIVGSDGSTTEIENNKLVLNQGIFENADIYISDNTMKLKYYYE